MTLRGARLGLGSAYQGLIIWKPRDADALAVTSRFRIHLRLRIDHTV
jgi:hypothetical protein